MRMKIVRKLLFAVMLLLGAAASALAQDTVTISQKEFEALKARVIELEKARRPEKAPAPKAPDHEELKRRVLALEKAPKATIDAEWLKQLEWLRHLEIHGVLEAEGSYRHSDPEDGTNTTESNLVMATVELTLDVHINDWLNGKIVLLYEEDDTDFGVDQAILRLANERKFPLYLEVGRMYVPFAPNAESSFITDPLTLEIGETSETALRLGGVYGPFEASISVFNGDVERTDEDDNHLEDFVAGLSFNHKSKSFCVGAGVAYINNIADSDRLGDANANGLGTVKDRISGLDLWAALKIGRFGLLGEYVGATGSFQDGEFDFNPTQKVQPRAWNLEGSMEINDKLTFACKYEHSKDLLSADNLPKERCGACLSYTLYKGDSVSASLSLEYLKDRTDNHDKAHMVTTQLAIEF